MNPAVKASFWFLIGSIIQKGMSVICTPIFTRIVDPTDYGKYTIYKSWYTIISIFATLNLSAGVLNNALTEDYENADRICSSFMGLTIANTLVVSAVLSIFHSSVLEWMNIPSSYLIVMLCESLFAAAYSIWAARQRYDYKYKGILLVSCIIAFLWPCIAMASIKALEDKAFALIISYAAIEIIIGVVICVRLFINGHQFYSKKYWKFGLSFNIPLIPHYLSYILLNQSDRIMIGRLVNESSAAFYGVAYSVAMIFQIVISAVENTLIPFVYKSIKSSDFKKLFDTIKTVTIFCTAGCVGAMLFGPEIMKIIAAPKYYDAVFVIPPVTASVFFIYCTSIVGIIEFYFKKTKFVMLATTVAAVINIILNYVFIQQFGYIAAGYTTYVSYVILLLMHYLFSRMIANRNLDGRRLYPDNLILICGIIISLIMLLCNWLYIATIVRLCIIGIIIAYFIAKRQYVFDLLKTLK